MKKRLTSAQVNSLGLRHMATENFFSHEIMVVMEAVIFGNCSEYRDFCQMP